MKRAIVALAIGLGLVASAATPAPVDAVYLNPTLVVRCNDMVAAVNAVRSPDVRLMRILCKTARQRAWDMAYAGRLWHDLGPVRRALAREGVCWRVVGEVLAWNDYDASGAAFVEQWRGSPSHGTIITGRWDRGGGTWVNWADRHWAVFYTLDLC